MKRTTRRWTRAALLGALLAPGFFVLGSLDEAAAQQIESLPPPGPWKLSTLPLDAVLHQAAAIDAPGVPAEEVRRRLAKLGLRLDESGRVQVEIRGPADTALPAGSLAALGVRVASTWRGVTEAWVPAARLEEAARLLPEGFAMGAPNPTVPDAVAGEGPTVTGSAGYRDRGLAGAGLTVAVLDMCYHRLTEARADGDAPSASFSTQLNYTPGSFEEDVEDCGEHGTACIEAIYDHLPAARYRLYKIDSDADLGTAVEDAISHGVDLISISLAYFNRGWEDDSGTPCEASNEAARAGVLVFTSAGNYARRHWQGTFRPGPDGDNRHDWVDGDETIDIRVPAAGEVSLGLSWNRSGGVFDYDLYLYDTNATTVLASSTNRDNTYEILNWKNTTGVERIVHVVVSRSSGGNTDMELFSWRGGVWLEHALAWSSTPSPSNATHPNVITVGAVDWREFESPSGTTGIIRTYSSQGPSNSGMALPDLAGPTNVSTFVWPTGFGGTSAAAPSAAGAAGALWSCATGGKGSTVRDLLFRWAQEGRDWGEAGHDEVYGHGGVHLPTFADCNANGAGDACDILRGASRDCDDDGTADDCQADSDGDGVIDVCDRCDDLDFDGYGLPGDPSCRLGSATDCDDGNPLLSPGTIEICDGIDSDCSGVADDHVCRGFDVDGNGVIDGIELAWLARAFGLCGTPPPAEWWDPVDFDRSTCVDGPDLSILGSSGVWAKSTSECSFTCPEPTGGR